MSCIVILRMLASKSFLSPRTVIRRSDPQVLDADCSVFYCSLMETVTARDMFPVVPGTTGVLVTQLQKRLISQLGEPKDGVNSCRLTANSFTATTGYSTTRRSLWSHLNPLPILCPPITAVESKKWKAPANPTRELRHSMVCLL